MKFDCACGATIVDGSDDLPRKAHLIPDQDWFATFDAIDAEVIAPFAAGRMTKDTASHLVRAIALRSARLMYQCRECGRRHVDDLRRQLRSFVPEGDGTSDLLHGRDGAP